jgi:DNA-binding NarL/FixJ family response regulator
MVRFLRIASWMRQSDASTNLLEEEFPGIFDDCSDARASPTDKALYTSAFAAALEAIPAATFLLTPSGPSSRPMRPVAADQRQGEVLVLLVRGLANKTIAAMLDRAESTIELHVSALLAKSQCKTRAQLLSSLLAT